MSSPAAIDLLALAACTAAACALRPRAHLACRLVAVAVLGAAALSWMLAHSAWLASIAVPALWALAAVGLVNGVAAWGRSATR